jgi:hypothetical protein
MLRKASYSPISASSDPPPRGAFAAAYHAILEADNLGRPFAANVDLGDIRLARPAQPDYETRKQASRADPTDRTASFGVKHADRLGSGRMWSCATFYLPSRRYVWARKPAKNNNVYLTT